MVLESEVCSKMLLLVAQHCASSKAVVQSTRKGSRSEHMQGTSVANIL